MPVSATWQSYPLSGLQTHGFASQPFGSFAIYRQASNKFY